MVFKDNSMISDTGNWNVAKDYSYQKIMKYLYLSDVYKEIAMFGSQSIEEELQLADKPTARMKGFQRLLWTLKTLCENTEFALNNEGQKDIRKYYKSLQRIENLLSVTIKVQVDKVRGTTKTIIKEKEFRELLEETIKIKKAINTPLNKADLIFSSKEIFDPHVFKQQLKDRAMSKG